MAFKNPLNLSSVHNTPKRNGFDRSRTNKFSASPGMLIPIMWEEVLPGDDLRISMGSLTRTKPLMTANFARVQEHIDVFAVNINDLWHYFNDFVVQNPQRSIVSTAPTGANPGDILCPLYQPVTDASSLSRALTYISDEERLDDAGVSMEESSSRLLDMLGYGSYSLNGTYDWASEPISLFPLLAYQKIYYDFYRNTDWELNNPLAYNVDYLNSSANIVNANLMDNERFSFIDYAPLQMRYANYKKDYFLGLKPNTQYGSVSVVSVTTDSVSPTTAVGNLQASSGSVVSSVSGSVSLQGTYDVLSLRKAEAMQRWAEVTGASKHNYAAQTEAHFNEKVPNVLAGIVQWLGGHVNDINVSEVLSTAETTDGSLGEVGGRAEARGTDNYVHFKNSTNCRYIVMAIYHIKPQLDFPAIGLNPQLFRVEPFDYYTPEFQNIGLAPVFANRLAIGVGQTKSNASKVLGYAPRFLDYKISYDEVHGQLRSDGVNKEWSIALDDERVRSMAFSDDSPNYLWYKVKPNCLDNMFLLQSNGSEVRDNFLCYFDLNIRFVRKMSVDGLPY